MLLLAPQLAHAFECTPSQSRCFVSIRWPTRDISYVLQLSNSVRVDRTLLIDAVDRSFLRWQNIPCTDLRFSNRGAITLGDNAPVPNTVTPITTDWADGLGHDPAALAVTTMTFVAETGFISRGRIELNDELFRFADTSTSCSSNEYDLESVLTHEIGHFLGLAHPCEFDPGQLACPVAQCDDYLARLEPGAQMPTMFPETIPCDFGLRSLEADDVAGVCSIYPRAEAPRSCYGLPIRDDYVANKTFGCGTYGVFSESSIGWFLLTLLPLPLRSILSHASRFFVGRRRRRGLRGR